MRPTYTLEHVLLGEDFLLDHNCVIEYKKKLKIVMIKLNDDLVATQPISDVVTKSQAIFNLEVFKVPNYTQTS